MITSSWRKNDVATLFWRHNNVIIAYFARWDDATAINVDKSDENSNQLKTNQVHDFLLQRSIIVDRLAHTVNRFQVYLPHRNQIIQFRKQG